jgi:hypothetical protein
MIPPLHECDLAELKFHKPQRQPIDIPPGVLAIADEAIASSSGCSAARRQHGRWRRGRSRRRYR